MKEDKNIEEKIEEENNSNPNDIKFADLGLKEEILKALDDMGFETPTPIQKKSIPHLLFSGKDIVGLAQTGTGKTAAFALPIIHNLDLDSKRVQSIILSPTRELALQISRDIEKFTKYLKKIRTLAVYGGTDIRKQIKALDAGVHIVVGTPGRVIDLINRKKLKLGGVSSLVLDEADEMLSMGFKEDMDTIMATTPEDKQTLLFSATMPKDIARLTKKYMKDRVEISAGEKNVGAKNVDHIYFQTSDRNRYEVLKRIADMNTDIYGIVFCRTRRDTKEVAERLIQDGYNADALHGDLSQAQRDYVMGRFRNKTLQLLIATDVAARGLDVDDLTHVINYKLPDNLESYIHRSGRTGRAGKKGTSIAIVTGKEQRSIKRLEKNIKKNFKRGTVPTAKMVCETKLYSLVDRMEKVKVNEEQIAPYMDKIYEQLSVFDRDELIKKFVSMEFNDFLSYYHDAQDLNDRRDGKRGETRENFTRFFINLGSNNGFGAGTLMEMINSERDLKGAEVGEIAVMKKFSFFEIESKLKDACIESLSGEFFKGIKVSVEIASSPASGGGSRGNRKRRGGSDGDRRGRRSKSFRPKGGSRKYKGGKDRSDRSDRSRRRRRRD